MEYVFLFVTAVATAVGIGGAQAAFTNVQPPTVPDNVGLECSVVKEVPRPWHSDRNPVYKTNIFLAMNGGNFESFGVVHTTRNGMTYDRSQQYGGGQIWKTNGKMEWYWKGYRGTRAMMLGEVYWNYRDGWMYVENLYDGTRLETQITYDCHDEVAGD